MSKRLILDEWSDDDIERNEGLTESQSKRQKRRQVIDSNRNQVLDESSKGGNNLISRLVNCVSTGISNIMNNSYKIFKSKPNSNELCETVVNESQTQIRPRGMNSYVFVTNCDTNMSYTMTQTNNFEQNLKIVNVINSSVNSCNFVFVNQPIRQTIQQTIRPVISIIPTQAISNTSPHPLVLCHNENNINVDKLKCEFCGQIASSPKTSCGHCGRKALAQNPNRISLTSSAIPVKQFYTTNNTSRRSLPTICSPDVKPMRQMKRLSPNSTIRLHELNTSKSQKPECIVLDEADLDKHESSDKTNNNLSLVNDECIEIQDSNETDEAFAEVGIQCDSVVCDQTNLRTNPKQQNSANNESFGSKSDKNRMQMKCSSVSHSSITNKEDLRFPINAFPEYIMFGTYRGDSKTMDFDVDGIKFTNVAPNNMETKFKYHIMIPFVEISELIYCSESSLTTIFLKPTKESNDKIQECMYLGKDSKNGLKFDINSNDIREHYIIAVLRNILSEKFIRILEKTSKEHNEDIKFSKMNIDTAKYMLQRVQSRTSNIGNSELRFEQTILSANSTKCATSRIEGLRPHQNPFVINAARPQLNSARDKISSSPAKKPALRSPRRPVQYVSPVQTVIQIDDDDDEDNGSKSQNDDEFEKVILTYPEDEENAIQLTGTDIICLNSGEFLNDNIVNFYLRYYFKSNKLSDDIRKRTHIFDTLFFVQLTEKRPTKRKNGSGREEPYTFEQRYNQKLKHWTKNVDIFSKDFLIFPIIKESHWFLAIVCNANHLFEAIDKSDDKTNIKKNVIELDESPSEKRYSILLRPCIIFMDSLGNASYKRQLSNPIKDFLTYEWNEKKGSEVSIKTKGLMRDFAPRVPNQTNSSDCGLFVLEYIEQFLEKPDYLIAKVFANSKNAFLDWFPIAKAKNKRESIRNLIFSLVPKEIALKLEELVKDEKESDDEDMRDEIRMEIDRNDDDYENEQECQRFSLDDSKTYKTRSTTSKSIQISETCRSDRNTIDLVEGGQHNDKRISKSSSSESVSVNMKNKREMRSKKQSLLHNAMKNSYYASEMNSILLNDYVTQPLLTTLIFLRRGIIGDVLSAEDKMACQIMHQSSLHFGNVMGINGLDELVAAVEPIPNRQIIIDSIFNSLKDMLMRVLSSSVNPIDIAMSSGYGSSLLSLLQLTNDYGIDSITYDRLPLILGRDFCGVVVSCGHAVDKFKVGDNVWGALPPYTKSGSHSQFIVANECHVYRKPSNLSALESASIPYVGLTAWAAICTIGGINQTNALGKRALVLGGSGGVGTFAIQLLRSWGCHVTTTCAGDAIDFVYTNTGADHCVDYNTNELMSSLGTFDFILNAASPGKHRDRVTEFAVKYLRKWTDAKYVTLSSPLLRNTDQLGLILGTALSAFQASKDTINGLREGTSARWAFYCPNSSALKSITELVEKCEIRPVIDKVINFNDLPQAYMKVSEGHARGKTVIDFT